MRSIMEKARSILYEGHLPLALWGEAVITATYLINITPSAAVGMRSPYQMRHRRIPTVSKLRTFGCTGAEREAKKVRNPGRQVYDGGL